MIKLNRVLYFLYYLKVTDFNFLLTQFKFVNDKFNLSYISLTFDVIFCSFKYNISFVEYFLFRFYNKSIIRSDFAGTGFMYEYHLKMNSRKNRVILDNKNIFSKVYSNFFIHDSFSLSEIKEDEIKLKKIINNKSGKFILKSSDGKCGKSVEVLNINDFNKSSIINYMQNNNLDVIESYIKQHDSLNSLSPSAVNTIRIFTQITKNGDVAILGARLRISINSIVDNLAAGNAAAEINLDSGIVLGKAVFSDITKEPIDRHPITNIKINGFQIPMWKEIIKLAKDAALFNVSNKSIGWDIVLTENGPGIIEGNHDWCKLLWQLPVNKGLKKELYNYL